MANGCSARNGTPKGADHLSDSQIRLNSFTDSLKSVYYSLLRSEERRVGKECW